MRRIHSLALVGLLGLVSVGSGCSSDSSPPEVQAPADDTEEGPSLEDCLSEPFLGSTADEVKASGQPLLVPNPAYDQARLITILNNTVPSHDPDVFGFINDTHIAVYGQTFQSGATVGYTDIDDAPGCADGFFSPSINHITLDENDEGGRGIQTMAHEAGHAEFGRSEAKADMNAMRMVYHSLTTTPTIHVDSDFTLLYEQTSYLTGWSMDAAMGSEEVHALGATAQLLSVIRYEGNLERAQTALLNEEITEDTARDFWANNRFSHDDVSGTVFSTGSALATTQLPEASVAGLELLSVAHAHIWNYHELSIPDVAKRGAFEVVRKPLGAPSITLNFPTGYAPPANYSTFESNSIGADACRVPLVDCANILDP